MKQMLLLVAALMLAVCAGTIKIPDVLDAACKADPSLPGCLAPQPPKPPEQPAEPPTTPPEQPPTTPPEPDSIPLVCFDPGDNLEQVIGGKPTRFAEVDEAVAFLEGARPDLLTVDGHILNWPSEGAKQDEPARIVFEALAAHLKAHGICAVAWKDALAVWSTVAGVGNHIEEYHLINHGGGRLGTARETLKFVFRAKPAVAPPMVGACPLPWGPGRWLDLAIENIGKPPTSQQISVSDKWCSEVEPRDPATNRLNPPNWPFAGPDGSCGTKCCRIGQHEGDLGLACEAAFLGAVEWSVVEGNVQLVPTGNPFNVKVAVGEGRVQACGSIIGPDGKRPCTSVLVRAQVGPVIGR